MQASRVRYRVRLRFTTWRLMAAVACIAVLGLIRDIDRADSVAGPSWSICACFTIATLLGIAVIATKIVEYQHQLSERRTDRSRELLVMLGGGGPSQFEQSDPNRGYGKNPTDPGPFLFARPDDHLF